jgi:hypothetical protein
VLRIETIKERGMDGSKKSYVKTLYTKRNWDRIRRRRWTTAYYEEPKSNPTAAKTFPFPSFPTSYTQKPSKSSTANTTSPYHYSGVATLS